MIVLDTHAWIGWLSAPEKLAGISGKLRFLVNFLPITDPYDENHNILVADITNHSIRTDSIFPETAEFLPAQCFTDTSRIDQSRNSVAQNLDDPLLNRAIEFR